MKYLKLFNLDSDYQSFIDNAVKPNVSYAMDSNTVYYNPGKAQNNEPEFVDLGLPSGTLWSTRNVGATSPEDVGLYFQWGDTQGYTADDVSNGVKQFHWNDYKYAEGGDDSNPYKLTKYNYNNDDTWEPIDGPLDNLLELELVDDAAYQANNIYRTPSMAQLSELEQNTTHSAAVINGVLCVVLTSTIDGYTDKSISIPISGCFCNGEHVDVNNLEIWSRNLCNSVGPQYGLWYYGYAWDDDNGDLCGEFYTFDDGYGRRTGMPIRPVKFA